jgi:multidrug resistance efflux pump
MADPRILAPIPTPPAQRWKEFRLLYLPRTAFVVGTIVVAILWSHWVAPATLVAEAEVTHRDVRAPQAGVLVGLNVDMLKSVKAGEVIGRVASVNPLLLEADLNVIRAELVMVATTMAGATDKFKMALDFESMQLNWMNHRVSVASLQGRLQIAEADLVRGEELFKQGLVTEANIQQLRVQRESLTKQLEQEQQLMAHLEPIVHAFAPKDASDADLATKNALDAALKVQDAKLHVAEQQLKPLALVAPIDGVVSMLARHNGEGVTAGEVVVRVTALTSDRITGFLRQPMAFVPKPGMKVELLTRGSPRTQTESKVLEVGPAMEPISATLMAAMRLPKSPPPPPGLRLQIEVPRGFKLVPGEFVDVVVKP